MGQVERYGASGTIWGKWNGVGQVERYGASGMVWGKWNGMGQVERYGASGTIWGKWSGMGQVEWYGASGTVWGMWTGSTAVVRFSAGQRFPCFPPIEVLSCATRSVCRWLVNGEQIKGLGRKTANSHPYSAAISYVASLVFIVPA